MSGWRQRLCRELGDRVELDVPVGPRVAFRIGGPADAWVRPLDPEQLRRALALAREEGLPVTLLGTGSNVLVSDLGIRGLVIRLSGALADVHLGELDSSHGELEAGAGALNAPLVALVLRTGLVGIEFLGTIPGTFGGALIMNAGAHGGEIAPFVESVTLIDREMRLEVRPGSSCGFTYRSSAFTAGEVLVAARLKVPKGDTRAARLHLEEMRRARKRTQPSEHPNAGSIFKNPPGDYAGRLIEACGLKGSRHGGALISPLHANFIVNEAQASAADVLALAALAQRSVGERFGVRLEWEVKRIGEWN